MDFAINEMISKGSSQDPSISGFGTLSAGKTQNEVLECESVSSKSDKTQKSFVSEKDI